ncbi:MAG: chemotaxis protein CheW [Roseovarius sp.]
MTARETQSDTRPLPPDQGRQMVLTFRLQGECFALVVTHVNEILDPIAQTPVPNAPRCAPALINVRGSVVPLFDIRHRLGMSDDPLPDTARYVVLDLELKGEAIRLALPVDAVEDVVEADLARLEAIPDLGARWPAKAIAGICQRGEDLLILLDTETVFNIDVALTPRAA